MRIASSKLRQRIAIQENEYTEINGSRVPGEWCDVKEMWSQITPMTGTRALEYGQLLEYTPYDILMRYKDDIPFDCDEGTLKRKYRIIQRDSRGNDKRIFTIHNVTMDDYENSYKIICYNKG